jgi:hypothetical protein
VPAIGTKGQTPTLAEKKAVGAAQAPRIAASIAATQKPQGTTTGTGGGGTSGAGGGGGGAGGGGGGAGAGGGGAAGGGTGGAKGGWGGLTLPPRPSWYHGIANPNQLAATIRDGWFAFLGDLSGFPYNVTIVVGGLVTVQIAPPKSGSLPAGAQVQLTVTDQTTQQGVYQGTTTLDANGSALFSMNTTLNTTHQYTVVVLEQVATSIGTETFPIGPDQTVLGQTLYSPGVTFDGTWLDVLESVSIVLTFTADGKPVSGAPFELLLYDLNAGAYIGPSGIEGPAIYDQAEASNAEGVATWSPTKLAILPTDQIYVQWNFGNAAAPIRTGFFIETGAQLATGLKQTIDISTASV